MRRQKDLTSPSPFIHTTRPGPRRRGMIIAEMVTGLILLGLILALAATTIHNYQQAHDQYLWRRTAAWAANAQFERLRAGASRDSLPPAGLVSPRITLGTETQPGEGAWRGFDLVTVTATVEFANRAAIHESVTGYLPPEVTP